MTNTERRELPAAELDLVVGGVILENVQITSPTFSTRALRRRFWWGEGVRK
jgi:hypothetical protein